MGKEETTPASILSISTTGHDGTKARSAEKANFNNAGSSQTGTRSDNASHISYYPGYGPHAPASSEYQQPSNAFPCYIYDPTYAGNGMVGASGPVKYVGSRHMNGFNTAKTNINLNRKPSVSPSNSKAQQSAPNYARPVYQNQPLNKSASLVKGYQHTGRFSSFTNRTPGPFMQNGSVNHRSNGRVWNDNYRSMPREKFGRNGEYENLPELTRGPRGDNRNNSSRELSESERLVLGIERDKYNLEEFQTEYDNAKFYVVKSYSEDDVHKCIKYDVWSSTPYGNKKLDAAFHEVEVKSSETGVRCPVFLFFSVNSSGQFVGVAEMIGRVDFSKSMNFWQVDKWNGFFPIKWHIIKDIPNSQLRYIILDNCDNRDVTYTRDTQEIGLRQGLEMLSIFKSYSGKTSLLDDYNFYENREKTLKMKRSSKQTSQTTGGYEEHFDAGDGIIEEQSGNKLDASSLISLTKNLSLNSQLSKSII